MELQGIERGEFAGAAISVGKRGRNKKRKKGLQGGEAREKKLIFRGEWVGE